MKMLLLRGQVPQDRNPQEIVFDSIEQVDDMWTQLFFSMTDSSDYSEVWYWGGQREKIFASNFVERWIPSFKIDRYDFNPDIIFCRGGFIEYVDVLNRFPNAIKIYYGAGKRFIPQDGFSGYDILLQDSQEQLTISRNMFPNSLSTLFIKPAADNIFYPIDQYKEYDICFPANGAQSFKGHTFVYSTIPKTIKLLNLGNNPNNYTYPNNVTSYRVLRSKMAENICKCKIGIVPINNEIDSCPRVIPEMLACGIPIVVLDTTRFWIDKYITPQTGRLATKENFWNVVLDILNNYDYYTPRNYYENNLTTKHASDYLKTIINDYSKIGK